MAVSFFFLWILYCNLNQKRIKVIEMSMRADVFFLFLGILYCKFGSKNVQSDKNEHESSVILIVIFYEF